jgi:hypothetical protein
VLAGAITMVAGALIAFRAFRPVGQVRPVRSVRSVPAEAPAEARVPAGALGG